jgi:hypothetical protein
MRFFAPVWLVICTCIALYQFNQGNVGNGLYYGVLAMVTAVSVSRM